MLSALFIAYPVTASKGSSDTGLPSGQQAACQLLHVPGYGGPSLKAPTQLHLHAPSPPHVALKGSMHSGAAALPKRRKLWTAPLHFIQNHPFLLKQNEVPRIHPPSPALLEMQL